MNSLCCDKCNRLFKSASSLSRHRHHSCPFNSNRTPRTDNVQCKTFTKRPYTRKTKPTTILVNAPNITNTQIDSYATIPNKSSVESLLIKQTKEKLTDSSIVQNMIHKTVQTDEINKIMNEFTDRVLDKLNKFSEIETKLDKLDKYMNNAVKASTNVFNIEKIQIYMTDSIDFIDVLTKRLGNRKQAVDYIRSKIHQKVEGDVDVFCEIYLHGEPDTWPISCPDKKHHVFRIAQPNAQVINDPGGIQIYKMFKNVYSNTLLRLNNSMIYDTLNKIPGTPEYEESRDQLLDSFEMGLIQDKAHDLCKAPCDPFIKKLSIKFKSLEKSYELDKV